MYYIKNRLQGLMLFLLLRITILYSQRTLCLDSDSVSLMKKTYIFFSGKLKVYFVFFLSQREVVGWCDGAR